MAKNKIKGITIKIGGDTSDLFKKLEQSRNKSKDLAQELKGVNSLLKFDPKNVELLTQKQKILTESIEEQKKRLDLLKGAQEEVRKKWEKYQEVKPRLEALTIEIEEQEKELKDLKLAQEQARKAFEKTGEGKEQYEALTAEVEKCENNIKELRKEQNQLNSETISDEEFRDYQREIINAEQKIKNLTQELKNFGSVAAQQVAAAGEKMKKVGKDIESVGQKTQKVSAGAALAIGGIVKGAADWETAFAGVKKTVDATEEEFEEIEKGLIGLSKTTASSATDIAAVAEAAGQLGIAKEDVVNFTKTMVMLGDSTNLTADEAASALAKLANITKMSSSDYDKLGSSIVDLGNNFATTERDIVEMTTRLASTGAVVGLTEPQMLAVATALSAVGINAEAGGSAISKLIKKMETSVATYDKSKQVIDSTGMSLRELQMLASHDSDGFKGMAASLGLTTAELKTMMNNVSGLQQFSNVAGMTAEQFKKAYGEDAVGALSAFINGLSAVDESGGSAVAVLQDMGLTEVRLSNAVLALASSDDILTKSLNTANGAWDKNSALSTEAEKRYATTESKLTQLKNTLTELAISLGDILLPIVNDIAEAIKGMTEKFTNANPATQKLILVILGITAAISPVLTIIGKLMFSIGSIMTYAPAIKAAITTITVGIKGIMAALAANPAALVIAAIAAVIAIVATLYNKCEPFKKFVDELWAKIKNFFKSIPEAFAQAKDKILEAWENVKTFFSETIPNIFTDFMEKIKEFFTVKIPEAVQSVIQWFSDLPYKIGYAIGQAIGEVIKFAQNVKEFFTVKVPEFLTKAVEWFKSLPGKIKTGIANAITHISDWCSKMKEKIVTGTKTLVTNTVDWFKSLPSKIKNAISSAVSHIGTWCTDMKNKAKTGIKNVADTIINGVKSLPSKMLNIGKNIVEGVWNGIKNATSWIKKKVGEFARGILDGIKDSLGIHSPSTVMRDMVGKFIPEGIAVGIMENAKAPVRALQKVANELVGSSDFGGIAVEKQIKVNATGTEQLGQMESFKTDLIEAIKQIVFELYIDTDTFVGGTVDKYNKALSQKLKLQERGGV